MSKHSSLPPQTWKRAATDWTIPQAAVWIRTRDQGLVESLTPREAETIFMADERAPGAFQAMRDHLVPALKRGSVTMRGQPAQIVERDGESCHALLDDVASAIPQGFWQDRGELGDDIDSPDGMTATQGLWHGEDGPPPDRPGREGEPEYHRYWVRLFVDRDAIIGEWQSPTHLLADGPLTLAELIDALPPGPGDTVAWFLCHDDVAVSGRHRGGRETIDQLSLKSSPLTIDPANNTLAMGDDLRWSAISIRLKSAADAQQPAAAPVGPPRVTQAPPVGPTLRGDFGPLPTPPQDDQRHDAEAVTLEPSKHNAPGDVNYPAEELSAETIVKAVAPGIKCIVADGLQLSTKQFRAAVLGMFNGAVLVKTIDAAWAVVADPRWRKQGGGPIIAEKRVKDWRPYFLKDSETN